MVESPSRPLQIAPSPDRRDGGRWVAIKPIACRFDEARRSDGARGFLKGRPENAQFRPNRQKLRRASEPFGARLQQPVAVQHGSH
jgi:hypothetical protein